MNEARPSCGRGICKGLLFKYNETLAIKEYLAFVILALH
jgi:hypothetical protein